MIDIIGNIKVDESRPERVKQLIACIRSYAFLRRTGAFINLFLCDCSTDLLETVRNELWDTIGKRNGHVHYSVGDMTSIGLHYGNAYYNILTFPGNEFVLNFMEDQFMMADNPRILENLLNFMRQYKADVCKSSFHKVEQNSIGGIKPIADVPGLAMVYDNTAENHLAYCSHYKDRYYIGVNFLTTRKFASKFWNRQLGIRPHPYEIPDWEPAWQHRCVIPHTELLAATDDNHGEPDTCLLHRPDAKKFWDIYNEL